MLTINVAWVKANLLLKLVLLFIINLIFQKGKVMKKLIIFVWLICLVGCAHQLELYSRNGGVNGTGTAQETTQSILITLDNVTYKGSYTYNGGAPVITTSYGTATAISGNRTAYATGTSVSNSYIPGTGQGRVFARSVDGKGLRCEFSYDEFNGLGICQDNNNQLYDLVIH